MSDENGMNVRRRLTGCVGIDNDQYILRCWNARKIVTEMARVQILKHLK